MKRELGKLESSLGERTKRRMQQGLNLIVSAIHFKTKNQASEIVKMFLNDLARGKSMQNKFVNYYDRVVMI